MKTILKVLDYAAFTVAFLGLLLAVLLFVSGGIVALRRDIAKGWKTEDNRPFMIAGVVAVGWCAIRWKSLTKRPNPKGLPPPPSTFYDDREGM